MGDNGTLGPVRVWTLAAGGMVGGGIYIALGVVVAAAGPWAWLSFLLAGVVAVASAHSYAKLSVRAGRSGGAFEFLEEDDRKGLAGTLGWLLVVGYVLTISVYVYAFGHYVAYAVDGGPGLVRGLGLAAGASLVALNLGGLGKMTAVEVGIVSGNLLALLGLAAVGLAHWDPTQLSAGLEPTPPSAALVGAAAIFVSYEGFQLLTYEFDQVRDAERLFLPVLVSAAVAVVGIYVAVALGATMLVGALGVVAHQEVALSVAAQEAAGGFGLWGMTLAAAMATAAAINATLFSTARLMQRVADDGELPAWFAHTNGRDVPDRSLVLVGGVATALALLGSLSSLVEAASLVFLGTFAVVNHLAARHTEPSWVPRLGNALGAVIGAVLVARLAVTEPASLAVLLGVAVLVFLGRPLLLQRLRGGEVTA